MRTSPFILLFMAAMIGWLPGCATGPVDDPLAVMVDRSRDPSQRIAAVQQLGAINTTHNPKQVTVTLHNLLWSDGEPTELRLLAMDLLIEDDADAFWSVALNRIREVDNWEVLNSLIDRMIEQGDPAFTVTLIRSYVRESQVVSDANRSEYKAIAALNPGKTVEQAIWEVIDSDDDNIDLTLRVDAWTLYNRLAGEDQARQQLMHSGSTHPLILNLQDAAWLDHIPANREGVLWLLELRSSQHMDFWQAARQRAQQLNAEQQDGLSLRHLPVLMEASDEQLTTQRYQMLERINERVPDQSYQLTQFKQPPLHLLGATPLMFKNATQQINYLGKLSWADMLALEFILDALEDKAFVQEVFRQADADMADTETEHGGVMIYRDGKLHPIIFPPDLKIHDRKFYSSDALIQRMYTSFFHYHYHVQEYRNTQYAIPGDGDMAFAQRVGPSALVFTFINRNTIDVDYYQPDGLIVDLGNIRR